VADGWKGRRRHDLRVGCTKVAEDRRKRLKRGNPAERRKGRATNNRRVKKKKKEKGSQSGGIWVAGEPMEILKKHEVGKSNGQNSVGLEIGTPHVKLGEPKWKKKKGGMLTNLNRERKSLGKAIT